MAAIWGGGHVAETSPIQGEKYKKQRQKKTENIYTNVIYIVWKLQLILPKATMKTLSLKTSCRQSRSSFAPIQVKHWKQVIYMLFITKNMSKRVVLVSLREIEQVLKILQLIKSVRNTKKSNINLKIATEKKKK